jgi:hypothetical protein
MFRSRWSPFEFARLLFALAGTRLEFARSRYEFADPLLALAGPRRTCALAVWAVLALGTDSANAQQLYTEAALKLGGAPAGLRAGDVDADGDSDLVARLQTAGGLVLVRSLGGAGFAAPQPVGSVVVPADFVLADLDADADLDLAELGSGSALLHVSLNDGAGQYLRLAPQTSFAQPIALDAGDVDGDGRTDLVGWFDTSATPGTPQLALWLGSGGGLYAHAQLTALAQQPSLHALGDLNADGYADAVFTSTYLSSAATPPVLVLPGSASGAFGVALSAQPFAAAAAHPSEFALADLDRDGALDLVAVNHADPFIRVALGDNAGGFADAQPYFSGANGIGLAIADLDADGWLDVASARGIYASANFAALYGAPGGALTATAAHGIGFEALSDLASGDFDGDGELDVAVAGPSAQRVSIHRALGARDFADVEFSNLLFGREHDVECSDWDHDGDLDAAASNFGGMLALFAADASGTLVLAQALLPVGIGTRIAAADIDNSGSVDFVQLSTNGQLELVRSSAPGVFLPPAAVGSAALPVDLAIADLDLDGRLDLVTSAAGGMSWYAGLGGGTFAGPTAVPLGLVEGERIAIADLDLDGRPDLAALDRGGNSIATARGLGGGTFAAPLAVPIGNALLDFAAGHLDQDNKFDLVATDASGAGLWVARNTGTGSFGTAVSFAAPAGGESPRLFDANADGYADVVYTEAPEQRLVLALGNGQAQFGNAQALAEGPDLGQLAIGDLDADGRCEIFGAGTRLGIWRGLAPAAASTSLYGNGTSGCLGRMGIAASGAPKIGTANFGLSFSNIGAGHGGYVVMGFAPDSAGTLLAPFGIVGHVNFGAGFQILSAHGSGGPTGRWKAPIPNDAGLVGLGLVFQAAWPWSPLSPCDPSPFLLSTSRGFSMTIGS